LTNDSVRRWFLNFVIDFGYRNLLSLSLMVKNILDIILCDHEQIICKLTIQPPLGSTDHAMVKFNIVLETTKQMYPSIRNDNLVVTLQYYDWL